MQFSLALSMQTYDQKKKKKSAGTTNFSTQSLENCQNDENCNRKQYSAMETYMACTGCQY